MGQRGEDKEERKDTPQSEIACTSGTWLQGWHTCDASTFAADVGEESEASVGHKARTCALYAIPKGHENIFSVMLSYDTPRTLPDM